MKIYFSISEAVIDLHERGFTDDFQLLGNHLLWIQEKILIRQKDFSIQECYSFIDSKGKGTIIFGVTAAGCYASGILINHYGNCKDETAAIIHTKLKKMTAGFLHTGGN